MPDTYFVLTERRRFALHVHRTGWRTAGEIAYELAAIRHLATKSVSVATPVAAADGSWLRVVAAPEGPRQLVLFHEAVGREAYADPGYPVSFAQSMAALHAAGDDFHADQPRCKVDLTTLLDRPLARIAPELTQQPNSLERWGYLTGLAERLRRAVAALPAAGLGWGPCHGDALGSNAHLAGSVETDTITHFDFDDCGPGWRVYDLATFRWIAVRRCSAADADACWAAYLRGYRQVRAIPELDLAAVPLVVGLRELWLMGQHARMAPLRGRWVTSFGPRLDFLHQWDQQHLAGI